MAFDKLSRLAPQLLGEKYGDLPSALESLSPTLLPSDSYREILSAFGRAVVFENGANFTTDEPTPLSDKNGYLSLDLLFGLGDGKNSIHRKTAQYAGELPSSYIPIGESSGGNLVCVDGNGVVNLWDHESQRNEGTWRIAASVDEFLSRLEPDDSGIGSTEGIIESDSFLDF